MSFAVAVQPGRSDDARTRLKQERFSGGGPESGGEFSAAFFFVQCTILWIEIAESDNTVGSSRRCGSLRRVFPDAGVFTRLLVIALKLDK
jgi:hypothetical protein